MIYRVEGSINRDEISKQQSVSLKGAPAEDPLQIDQSGKNNKASKSFQGDLVDYLSEGRDAYDNFSSFLVRTDRE